MYHKERELSYSISRRTVLRGLGVALSLPLLNVMRPVLGSDSQFKSWSRSQVEPVPRAIFCYVPNGVNIQQWQPDQTGHDYQLSSSLKVLEEMRSEFSVLSGLGHPHSEGGHSGADTWLTGADLKAAPGKDYANTIGRERPYPPRIRRSVYFKDCLFPNQQKTNRRLCLGFMKSDLY